MRSIRCFVLLSMMLLLPQSGQANLALQLDLEAKIHDKLQSILSPEDPDARIVVTAVLKKIKVVLPGIGAISNRDFLEEPTTPLQESDLDSIRVTIRSSLDPFPDSLKKSLEEAVSLKPRKKKFTYEVIEASLESKVKAQAWSGLSRLGNWIYVAPAWFLGFTLFLILSLLMRDWVMRRSFSSAVDKIVTGVKEAGVSGNVQVDREQVEIDVAGTKVLGKAPEKTSVQLLPTKALIALLSDSYWCHLDDYAAWIWSSMNSTQREQVLRGWQTLASYASYLTTLEGKFASYHDHPYYLNPLPLQDLPQDELADWIQKNNRFWHSLSPMRRANLELSLQDRLRLQSTQPAAQAPKLPTTAGTPREIARSFELERLNEADEIFILENQHEVPENLRSRIRSLVWVALLGDAQREAVLSQFSAQELAQVWIAPQVILDKIAASIPKRKLDLLKEYQSKVRPNRASAVFNRIVQVALAALTTAEARQEGESQNAA